MHFRPQVLGCLIVFAATAALPFAASTAAAPKGSPLDGVAALGKPISCTETKISVGELIRKVSAETGVELKARREVADEPVALAVKEMPARELLEQVADFLEYTWLRKQRAEGEPPAFELYQSVASKQREEALRQAGPAAAWQNVRAEIGRLAGMARLSQAQIQSIRDVGQRRLDEVITLPRSSGGTRQSPASGNPSQRQAIQSTPEWMRLSQEVRAAQAVASPISRVVAGFLGRLSAEQWAGLRREHRLLFSSQPQSPAGGNPSLPLPAETAHLFGNTPLSEAPGFNPQGSPEEIAQIRAEEKARQASWSEALGYRVQIILDDRAADTAGVMSLQAAVSPLLREGRGDPFGGDPRMGLVVNSDTDEFMERQSEMTPERLAEWAKDPVFGRVARFEPRVKPGSNPYAPGGDRWRLRNMLPDLARTYDVPFIAHAYWSTPGTYGVALPVEPTPLFRILELVGYSYWWDRRGELVRLHSRAWYRERPREVPLRLVRRWAAIGERYGALPLDEYAAMATELTDLQMQAMGDLDHQVPLPPGLEDIGEAYGARHGLRLYGTLTPPQRDALWGGRPLVLERTTGLQRQRFLAALQGIGSEADPFQDPAQRSTQWSEPRFSVNWTRMTRSDDGEGGVGFAGRDEKGPPPPPVELTASISPAALPDPSRPGPRRSTPAGLGLLARRAFTQVQFEFADAEQPRHRSRVTIAVSQ